MKGHHKNYKKQIRMIKPFIFLTLFFIHAVAGGNGFGGILVAGAFDEVICVLSGRWVEMQNGGGVEHKHTCAILLHAQVQAVGRGILRRGLHVKHAFGQGFDGSKSVADFFKNGHSASLLDHADIHEKQDEIANEQNDPSGKLDVFEQSCPGK